MMYISRKQLTYIKSRCIIESERKENNNEKLL
nr:MAG TPA: hypothetical protein [Microviridae sp.]